MVFSAKGIYGAVFPCIRKVKERVRRIFKRKGPEEEEAQGEEVLKEAEEQEGAAELQEQKKEGVQEVSGQTAETEAVEPYDALAPERIQDGNIDG